LQSDTNEARTDTKRSPATAQLHGSVPVILDETRSKVVPRIHWFSIRGLPRAEKKLENYRNKRFISFTRLPSGNGP